MHAESSRVELRAGVGEVMYAWLQRVWYEDATSGLLLVPLSWVFGALVGVRRALYRAGVLRSYDVGRPVVVVGNVSVGGTGKTPLTLWLAERLRERGMKVGVAMRGYGAAASAARIASSASTAAEVGDEAALVARRGVATVGVGHDRVAVARLLVDAGCDVILADDGLQHLRLRRDVEILVVDGARGFGNGRLLPAGPLRESPARAATVDAIVINGPGTPLTGLRMALQATEAVPLHGGAPQSPAAFTGRRVHAVAAIGHPARFFATLREHGIDPIEHAWPDHALLRREDITFGDGLPVLMTEKDAVKCGPLASAEHWYVRVAAVFSPEHADALLAAAIRRRNRR